MTAEAALSVRNRIVVVEDSEAVRKSLALLLRTRGYAVDLFETGLDLLSVDALPDADCFLIDFRLPGQDGVQVLEALRRAGRNAPAILITACLTADVRARAIAAGFRSIIEKPPRRLSLVDEIANAISEAEPPPAAA
jgi:two-component system, LuxR family, response regulator FixJ